MIILSATNLKKYYGEGVTQVKALDGVDVKVSQGEFVAVVGSSGSGKTTLLRILGGLDAPTSGIVRIGGRELAEMPERELTIFRRKNIGFIFQDYNLLPLLNVYENIVLPIQLDGRRPDEIYVKRVVSDLGLQEKVNTMPNCLSGGQQQRVAIARALVSKPAIILADEPTGNLDVKTSHDVMNLLRLTSKKYRQTVIMITHNSELAQKADRIIHIEDGKILRAEGGAVV